MPFEAFVENAAGARAAAPGRRVRRIMYAASAIVHALAVLVAVAYSYWHVEELAPPRVTVTFISVAAPPPPPPPPPPLGGGSTAAAGRHHLKVSAATIIPPPHRIPDVVQPRPPDVKPTPVEPVVRRPTPPSEPKDDSSSQVAANAPPGVGVPDGVRGGTVGGLKSGVLGGTLGGTGTVPVPAPLASKFLPPQMGAQQKLSGADPEFPSILRTAGATYRVITKVCVDVSGAVSSVAILKRAHPTLDGNVVTTVRTWRFRPLMANGTPVPFCYPANFDFSSER